MDKTLCSLAKALAGLGLAGACGWGVPGEGFKFDPGNPDGGSNGDSDAGRDPGPVVGSDAGVAPDARVDRPEVVQAAYLKASNIGAGDRHGFHVALWGDTLAVGAIDERSAGDQGDDSLVNSGAVYMYRRSGGGWVQEEYLKASNPHDYSDFGYAVSLWGDTLAVGARGDNSAGTGVNGDPQGFAQDAGAVYVFRRSGATWVQEAYIKASNTSARDEFGTSVALWGDTLVVGAPDEDSSATGVDGDQMNEDAPNSGAAYVFRRTGGVWAQEAYLKASNSERFDLFGISVALHGDTLAVGALQEDGGAAGVGGDPVNELAPNSGAVYVFRRSGSVWRQEAYVKASNPEQEDEFGRRVALWDGTLAVSAWLEDSGATGVGGDQDNNEAANSGAVYLFRRDGAVWAQEGYLKASNTSAYDRFGSALALMGDMLAVGAPLEDSRAAREDGSPDDDGAEDSGAAYLFRRVDGAWTLHALIKAAVADAGDNFGASAAISADALIVGAPGEDSAVTGIGAPYDNDAVDSGAAYVFDY